MKLTGIDWCVLMDAEPGSTGEEAGAGGGALSGAGDGGGSAGAEGAGALSGAGAADGGGGDAGAAGEPDWDNMTDDDYFKGFTAPEGVDLDVKEVARDYGKFLRENHIPQKAFSDFLKIADGVARREDEASRAEAEKEEKALRDQMAAERKDLEGAFNPEQIGAAVGALRGFADDKVFFEHATGRLANSRALVRLLVNWAETHRDDGLPGTKPAGGGGDDFVRNWTGATGAAR